MPDEAFEIEAIGEVYAQALLNEAKKQGAVEQVTEDVRGIGGLLKSNAIFAAFTESLAVGEEERLAALDKIFSGRVHPLTVETLKSLARRGRFMFLGGMVEGFEAILKKMGGRVDVELVTSSELGADVLAKVTEAVGKSVGQAADVKVKVDPGLIGGMTLRIGDTLIDGSVFTQLKNIETQLKRRGVSSLQGNVAGVLA